jgi:multisubunit Na+/H+ antiporter MnhB subunit
MTRIMHATSQQLRNISFFVLLSIFAVLFALFGLNERLIGFPFSLLVVLAIALVLFGLAVVVLTVRLKEARAKKICFLMAGASAAGIPICVLLHNLIYALFILWFGEGFWERNGTDEVVFFILATVVCPALFLVGTLGSIVFLTMDFRDRWQRTRSHTREPR